jgi:hypothetical protein
MLQDTNLSNSRNKTELPIQFSNIEVFLIEISFVDPDPDWIRNQWGVPGSGSAIQILIQIQEGKNNPQKQKKVI